jgi:hypothetical protein
MSDDVFGKEVRGDVKKGYFYKGEKVGHQEFTADCQVNVKL